MIYSMLIKKKCQYRLLVYYNNYFGENFFMPQYKLPKVYDPTECNRLRKIRKNITNKIYRRNKKLESTTDPAQKNQINESVQELSIDRDLLNGEIWQCSLQFHNLSSSKKKIDRQIRYREKQANKYSQTDRKKFDEYKSQIKNLKGKIPEIEKTMFYGSPRYSNIHSNFKKIGDYIGMLTEQFKNLKKQYDAGKFKTKEQYDSARQSVINKIKEMADDQRALEELISNKRIVTIKHDRVEFDQDLKNDTEYSEHTIFWYYLPFSNILSRKIEVKGKTEFKYKTVIISQTAPDGSVFSTAYSYPNQQLELDNAIIELDDNYSADASSVYLSILVDNKNRSVTLSIHREEQIEEEILEDE